MWMLIVVICVIALVGYIGYQLMNAPNGGWKAVMFLSSLSDCSKPSEARLV